MVMIFIFNSIKLICLLNVHQEISVIEHLMVQEAGLLRDFNCSVYCNEN